MRIELVGLDCPRLPGVTVGVQQGSAVVDQRPADGTDQRWALEADVVDAGGEPDLRGPFVHGRRGERFLYLVWSREPEGMFRRAKLMLAGLPAEVSAGSAAGHILVGRVRLVLDDGSPVCAAVRPPQVTWATTTS